MSWDWVSFARAVPRRALRALPAFAVLFAFVRLGQGGFGGLAALGWLEAAAVALLLWAVALGVARRVLGAPQSGPARMRDDVELGGCLVAAAFVIVSIGGPPLFPLLYLLVAFLVSYLPRPAALTLVGIALVFDAGVNLGGRESRPGAFLAHAAFLILFAALYHFALSARLVLARRAESAAVKNRIKEAFAKGRV